MATSTEPTLQEQPLLPPPPPPMVAVSEQMHTANTAHGSVGPVIAVLAVIAILGVAAGMIGRLCSGRSIMGYGHFDVEGWMETKFSSCLDGRFDRPPQPLRFRPSPPPVEEAPVAVPTRNHSGVEAVEPPGTNKAAAMEGPVADKKEEREDEEGEEEAGKDEEEDNSHGHERAQS